MQRGFMQSVAAIVDNFAICGTKPSALVSTFHLSEIVQAVG